MNAAVFPLGPRAWVLALLVATGALAATGRDAGTVVSFAPDQHHAQVSAPKVKLGEPFSYEIVLRHAQDARYELPTGQLDLGPFELLGHKRHREDKADGSITTVTLSLALFELGEQSIPALTFEVVRAQGAGTWTIPPTQVEGVGTLPAATDSQGAAMRDLKPLAQVPVRSYRLVYALLALLAAAGLAYAAYRYWKRLPAQPPIPVAPPQPLHQRTRAALDVLAAEDLPGQGKVKEFYFRLSEILRGYLGERYGFEALESTSPELLTQLQRRHTPGLRLDELSTFTAEADLVKFAKAQMGPLECKRALELAYRVVDATPFPPAPPAG